MFRDRPPGMHKALPLLHKVVSLICTPTIIYPCVISYLTDMTVSQVADEVLYTGLLEMHELQTGGRDEDHH